MGQRILYDVSLMPEGVKLAWSKVIYHLQRNGMSCGMGGKTNYLTSLFNFALLTIYPVLLNIGEMGLLWNNSFEDCTL